jgi:hypothetical protein
MLLDSPVAIAAYAVEISFHDAVVIGLAILISLAFWAALHYQRKRTVYLTHSEATNQVMLELSRIANALDDIVNRAADQTIAAASRPEQDREYRRHEEQEARRNPPPPDQRERQPGGMPYSLFGR